MKRRSDYSKFKGKFYWMAVLFALVLITFVLMFASFLSGRLGNGVVWFLQTFFRMDFFSARNFYWSIMRSNDFLPLLLGALSVLPLVTGFIFWTVRQNIKYLEEVAEKLEVLVEGEGREVVLSPELGSMEKNLNTLKQKLNRREREAKEAEQRKNDLLMYLAHDLKTPLTSVIGYLNLLDEASDMPTELRKKYVGITLDKANSLEYLINEFFEITRFNTSTLVIHKEKLNLSYMLWQLADEFYPQLEPLGKEIEIEAEDELNLWADGDKLARVFNNILRNAVAYSYENTNIMIRAKRVDDEVIISLSNQGDPIPPQKLETIFEKFFRLDQARSTQTGGSGLGLAIAKEIVEAHGGTITAESNKEQTIFTVRIPLKEDT